MNHVTNLLTAITFVSFIVGAVLGIISVVMSGIDTSLMILLSRFMEKLPDKKRNAWRTLKTIEKIITGTDLFMVVGFCISIFALGLYLLNITGVEDAMFKELGMAAQKMGFTMMLIGIIWTIGILKLNIVIRNLGLCDALSKEEVRKILAGVILMTLTGAAMNWVLLDYELEFSIIAGISNYIAIRKYHSSRAAVEKRIFLVKAE